MFLFTLSNMSILWLAINLIQIAFDLDRTFSSGKSVVHFTLKVVGANCLVNKYTFKMEVKLNEELCIISFSSTL